MAEKTQPYPPTYTLHHTRCDLGWTIFMSYCRNWEAAALGRLELEPGNAYLNSLISSAERALEAHRIHQNSCQQCLARRDELNSLGEAS